MKLRLNLLLLTLLACGAFAVSAAETPRIAVVRMENLFRDYHKSKIAEETIRQQAEMYRTYLAGRQAELRKAEKEMLQLRDDAQNIAMSAEFRSQQEAKFQEKQRELALANAEFQRLTADRSQKMRELEQRKRKEVLDDIRNEIARTAGIAGYDLVLDATGMTTNSVPAVLYAAPHMDITDKILKNLNDAAAAPVVETEKK